jgi:hypothetical protein
MVATELRIGNYYDSYGEIKQVTPNVIEEVFTSQRSWCKPIPLTEEWLLKFGFNKENTTMSSHHGPFFSISIDDYKYCFAYAEFRKDWGFYQEYTDSPFGTDNDKKYFVSHGIINVHQIQNLWLALTGEELILKSSDSQTTDNT